MHKKLLITCAAVAAFAAFVIAPAASASPVLTSEGKAVALGTTVKGSNTGIFKFQSSAGGYTIECSSVSLDANVTANAGTKIQLEAAAGGFATSGTGTSGDCTASWGPAKLAWGKMCFATVGGTDNVTLTGCGGNLTLTTNITGTADCLYAAASGTGTFVTGADAKITVSSLPEKLTESSFFCPTEVQFSMVFDLTTATGGTLLIS
jgi:hypothetical protein